MTREREQKAVQERESKRDSTEVSRFRKDLAELMESTEYEGAEECVQRQLVGTLVVNAISRLTSQE